MHNMPTVPFTRSGTPRDREKSLSVRSRHHTSASASLNVGANLAYQTAWRPWMEAVVIWLCASSVTNENRPIRAGVVRRLAAVPWRRSGDNRWIASRTAFWSRLNVVASLIGAAPESRPCALAL